MMILLESFLPASLRSIVIPASVTTISGLAFTDCHLDSMHIDEGNSHF
jgi:hypothetical protein